MFAGNPEQWYTLLDNSKNAAGQIVVSSQQIKKLRDKDHPKLGGENQKQDGQMGIEQQQNENGKVDLETAKVNDKQLFHNPTLKRIIHYVEKPVNYMLSACSFSLLLLATILLIWQLISKVKSYLDNPVLVTSSYTYPDSLPMPIFYFCNTKYLSANHMSENYPEILNLFKYVTENSNIQEVPIDISSEFDMSLFYMDSTKNADDFFIQCQFSGNECNMSNIEKILTDVGVCHTLNDKVLPSNISHAGTTNSFSFLLNLQSYDSIPTSDKTSDVMVAFLDRKRPPIVAQLGFHVSPGFQTSVALSYHKTKRLSKFDKGKCDHDRKLKFYDSYSFEACLLERIFEHIYDECGCYSNFMPSGRMNDSTGYCNAKQEILCAQRKFTDYGTLNVSKCPETCESVEYVPSLSYGKISTRYVQNVIDRSDSKYTTIKARDVTTKTTKMSPSNMIKKWYHDSKTLLECFKATPNSPARIATPLDDNLNSSEVLNISAADRMFDSPEQPRNVYENFLNLIGGMIFRGRTVNQSCLETLTSFTESFKQLRHRRSSFDEEVVLRNLTIDDSFVQENIVMIEVHFKDLSMVTVDESLTYSQLGLAGDIAGTIGIIIGFIGTTGLALYQTLKTITGRVKSALKKKLIRDGDVGSADSSKNVVLVVHEYETDKMTAGDKEQKSTFDALRRRFKRKSSL